MTNPTQQPVAGTAPLSVVMAVHDQADALRRNLPLLLDIHYEPGYEVIVVDIASTDDTADVLTQLKHAHPHLYTTRIPPSSHYVSLRKLALTLGMKAARYEWVVVTEATCRPDSTDWLETLSRYMTKDSDVVAAYTAYDEGATASHAFLRLANWHRQLRHPYRYDGACLAVRKSAFMQRNGFLRNLQFLHGEYDFLVNETPAERISLVRSPHCCMRQEPPAPAAWAAEQLYYMQTRTHLTRATLSRLLFVLSQGLLHTAYIATLAAITAGAVMRWPLIAAAGVLLLLGIAATRTWIIRKRAKALGEHIATWKMPLLDLRLAWHYVYYLCRYLMTDKHDFKRK